MASVKMDTSRSSRRSNLSNNNNNNDSSTSRSFQKHQERTDGHRQPDLEAVRKEVSMLISSLRKKQSKLAAEEEDSKQTEESRGEMEQQNHRDRHSFFFEVGDRVVVTIHDHHKRHGCIAAVDSKQLQNCKVQFDLSEDPSRPLEAWMKAPQLQREAAIAPSSLPRFVHGRLEDAHAEALWFLLRQMRRVVSRVFCGDKHARQDPTAVYQQTVYAWRHWANVYQTLRQYLTEHVLCRNTGLTEAAYPIVWKALEDVRAVRGWSTRIQGVFWVVGVASNGSGAYLIPDSNHKVVYKALCGDPHQQVHVEWAQDVFRRPIKLKLTLLNWFGCLVTDGVVSGTRRPGFPKDLSSIVTADNALSDRLQQSVTRAFREGRIIARLNQLELRALEEESNPRPLVEKNLSKPVVTNQGTPRAATIRPPRYNSIETASTADTQASSTQASAFDVYVSDMGGSRRSSTTSSAITRRSSTISSRRSSVSMEVPRASLRDTALEESLLAQLLEMEPRFSTDDQSGCWVYKRLGCTEETNPQHAAMVYGDMTQFGTFACSQVQPTSVDVLRALLICVSFGVWRPGLVFVDDKACCERLQSLAQCVDDFYVEYFSNDVMDAKGPLEFPHSVARDVIRASKRVIKVPSKR